MGLDFSVINISVNSSASFYNTGQHNSLRSYPLEFSHMFLCSISSISRCLHLSYPIKMGCCDADSTLYRSPKLRDLLKKDHEVSGKAEAKKSTSTSY